MFISPDAVVFDNRTKLFVKDGFVFDKIISNRDSIVDNVKALLSDDKSTNELTQSCPITATNISHHKKAQIVKDLKAVAYLYRLPSDSLGRMNEEANSNDDCNVDKILAGVGYSRSYTTFEGAVHSGYNRYEAPSSPSLQITDHVDGRINTSVVIWKWLEHAVRTMYSDHPSELRKHYYSHLCDIPDKELYSIITDTVVGFIKTYDIFVRKPVYFSFSRGEPTATLPAEKLKYVINYEGKRINFTGVRSILKEDKFWEGIRSAIGLLLFSARPASKLIKKNNKNGRQPFDDILRDAGFYSVAYFGDILKVLDKGSNALILENPVKTNEVMSIMGAEHSFKVHKFFQHAMYNSYSSSESILTYEIPHNFSFDFDQFLGLWNLIETTDNNGMIVLTPDFLRDVDTIMEEIKQNLDKK